MVVTRCTASSYFEGSLGRESLGYLKNSACGEAAPTHSGNLSDPRMDPRVVAVSIRAPKSAGAWSTENPTSPNNQVVRNYYASLGNLRISRTVLIHNESECLIRVAIDAVRALPNIVHELWGCSRGFAVEGDGNGGCPQESEQRTIFVDSEELLIYVIPFGSSQSPGVRGNREDVGRLGES